MPEGKDIRPRVAAATIGIWLLSMLLPPAAEGQTNGSQASSNWWERSVSTAPSPLTRGAVIESVSGVVLHQEADTETESPILQRGKGVNKGDRLRTKENSRAVVLTLREAAAVDQVTRVLLLDPFTLEVRSGRIYFRSIEVPGTAGDAPRFLVRTPTGTFTPTSTEFQLTVDPATGRTDLIPLKGEVLLHNRFVESQSSSGLRTTVVPSDVPPTTARLDAVHINDIIQWALYYPAILDPDELPWPDGEPDALRASLRAYRSGNLHRALAEFPTNWVANSDGERIYHAAVLLAVGGVDQVGPLLRPFSGTNASPATNQSVRLARALEQLIAAVKFQEFPVAAEPTLASEWMSESYYRQSRTSRTNLTAAREAAQRAVGRSPQFSFAWARLAELEFSFGQTSLAADHLGRALELAKENAQAIALQGFLLAAQEKAAEATNSFQRALAIDPGLGNAWLGLGLCHIRLGNLEDGLRFVQTAVTAEPQRSLLRSYLGKAYHEAGLEQRAGEELKLAQEKDPADPTPWLYSALLKRQQNRINEAVADLEKSRDLNDNRSLYRSGLLLDQDRAVRSVGLAKIYRDAGMEEVSLREASRAVQSDYANYSAHLFLADSYSVLNDPRVTTLRYETPWANELLVANLLSPVGGSSLSQSISQQEYSHFFDRDYHHVFSLTEYGSGGDWSQAGSVYGRSGRLGYALDTSYLSQNGERPNNDQDLLQFWLTLQGQITENDSVLAQVIFRDGESGDLNQYFDPASASQTLRVKDRQEPIVLAGYHHQWGPEHHTLLLAAHLDGTSIVSEQDSTNFVLIKDPSGQPINTFPPIGFQTDYRYRSHLDIYSAELQHIWQAEDGRFGLIAGGRYQFGDFTTEDTLANPTGFPFFPPIIYNTPLADQRNESDFRRGAIYAYQNWRALEPLLLTVGVSYDSVHYPINHTTLPISAEERNKDRVSPKVGLIWTPAKHTTVRGAYTRSLGGVSFDQSIRLEPSQVSGFVQSYRSLIPDSIAGTVPAATFDTLGVSVDQQFPTATYVGVAGELLESKGDQFQGVFSASNFAPIEPDGYPRRLSYREQSLLVTLNQLLGREWSLGARYRLSHDQLGTSGPPERDQDYSATLQQLNLHVLYNHPCGFFSQAEAIWYHQKTFAPAPPLADADFWQANVFVGYRFWQRRLEARAGLLNVTDEDYRLNPLNYHPELPRERTFFASLKLNF